MIEALSLFQRSASFWIPVGIVALCLNPKLAKADFPIAGAGSVTLARGPYLQMGTPSSIRVKWRTEEPSESLIMYGTDASSLHFLAGDLDQTTDHEVSL